MGLGFLRVEATTAGEALPVAGARITVRDAQGNPLFEGRTDENGTTGLLELAAPDAYHTLSPADTGPHYAVYTVTAEHVGYDTVTVEGVQLFDGETSLLPVEMHPQGRSGLGQRFSIPRHDLEQAPVARQDQQEAPAGRALVQGSVVIPQTIVVHLGTPSSNARNIRVDFSDYIKNVASSEIYPTWPAAALEANIYCQISFALNRVYTEWYPSRGYAFHITNSTAYDQSFVEGRNIYANISQLVDRIFNVFVRRAGYGEPYFTQYCNGTTVTCRGLSQWGTVPLANQGLDAFRILRNYYPADIQLITSNNIANVTDSYPGTPLRQGSQGADVQRMQRYLNRIRTNYPLIPSIANPNGVFGADTAASVTTFQRTFSLAADGVVGKATWYKIINIYNAVKKLADLDSEGDRIGIGQTPPTSVLREGARGGDVVQLQFLLSYIAAFFNDIPTVLENAQFDSRTKQSVTAFQRKYGLAADGIVGPATWNQLYSVYRSIEEAVETPDPPPVTAVDPPYPGTLLRVGSRGESVLLVQRYLNTLFRYCPNHRALSEDGIFGENTRVAVVQFQGSANLPADGIVGPQTWNALVGAYQSIAG